MGEPRDDRIFIVIDSAPKSSNKSFDKVIFEGCGSMSTCFTPLMMNLFSIISCENKIKQRTISIILLKLSRKKKTEKFFWNSFWLGYLRKCYTVNDHSIWFRCNEWNFNSKVIVIQNITIRFHCLCLHTGNGHANYRQSYQQLHDWFDFDDLPKQKYQRKKSFFFLFLWFSQQTFVLATDANEVEPYLFYTNSIALNMKFPDYFPRVSYQCSFSYQPSRVRQD